MASKASSTFFVPKRNHSALIGKGGAVVRGLQEKHHANIAIPRSDNDSSAITVSASSAADVEAVRVEFERLLGFPVSSNKLEKVYLDIPTNEMGMIIGRQGSTIKKLQQDSNCSIYVPRSGDASPYVEVEGTSADVAAAIEAIGSILGYEPARVGNSAVAEIKVAAAPKLNLGTAIDLTKPIYEALFYPDTDSSDGLSFDRFLAYLGTAKQTMDLCVFTITDDRVAKLLKDAHARGVKVRLITDNDTAVAQGSDIQDLADAGIVTKTDNTEYHMHHKFAVLDNKLLISGSFNWTWSASKNNQENQIITNNQSLVNQFAAHFNRMWADPQFVLVHPK